MIVYRLEPLIEINEDIHEYLYDVDEDYITKKEYIESAKKWTFRVNEKFNTNYKWTDLFLKPIDRGWRYCKKCGCSYWLDDCCEC